VFFFFLEEFNDVYNNFSQITDMLDSLK